MYLVDTNVWLERLLDQTRSEEVGQFLARVPSERLFISDFAFHSIGVVLSRLKQVGALLRFATAEKYHLSLVSFDTDFDHTERGRSTPQETA